jgi:FdhD protein
MTDARDVEMVRFRGLEQTTQTDEVAHEEPLELQVNGTSIAVLMRTPGHDEELVRGFLLTERVIASLDQLDGLQHCTQVPDPEAEDNVMQARLRPDVVLDLERLRRHCYASSSCGVCGKATIDNAMAMAAPLEDGAEIDAATLYALPQKLRTFQHGFARTGGLHAAGLFSLDGRLLALREDVGRHNAVDKIVGWLAEQGGQDGQDALDARACCLVVSGRVSYELVQKAVAARLPLLAGVSAPTSLAVRAASAHRLTVVGFLRGNTMNVYATPHRVRALR